MKNGYTIYSAIVAALGVIVGAVLTYLEIRSLVRTRKTDLVIGIWSLASTREYLEAWEKFIRRKIPDLSEHLKKHGYVEYNMVMVRLDPLGALLGRKLIDVGIVQDLWGHFAVTIWEQVRPLLEEREKETGEPHTWQAVEYLYNEMKKREQQLTTTS